MASSKQNCDRDCKSIRKNAAEIVVLGKGKIIEVGTHVSLTEKRGAYYDLVRNQLELGN